MTFGFARIPCVQGSHAAEAIDDGEGENTLWWARRRSCAAIYLNRGFLFCVERSLCSAGHLLVMHPFRWPSSWLGGLSQSCRCIRYTWGWRTGYKNTRAHLPSGFSRASFWPGVTFLLISLRLYNFNISSHLKKHLECISVPSIDGGLMC